MRIIYIWLLIFSLFFSRSYSSESLFSSANIDVNELLGPLPHWLDKKALFLSKDKPIFYPLKMISGKDSLAYEVRYFYSKETKALDEVRLVRILPTGEDELISAHLQWKIFGSTRLLTNLCIEDLKSDDNVPKCLVSHYFKYNDKGSLRRHIVEGGFLKGNVEKRETSFAYDDDNKLERFTVRTNGKNGRTVTIQTENEKIKSLYDPEDTQILKEKTERLPNNIWRKESSAFVKGKISSQSILEWELGPHNEVKWVSVIGSNGTKRTTSYRYDRKGQVSEKTKADGTLIFYEYDKDGRLCHISSSDHTVDYRISYDEKDRIIESYDAINSKTVKRKFSDDGILVQEIQNGYKVRVEFEGRTKKRLILPDESAIDYYYDDEGNLKRIKRLDPSLFAVYEYNIQGLNEFVKNFYPQVNNFTNSAVSFEQQDPVGLYEVDVSYDSLGQISNETGEFSHSFLFDALGRAVLKDSRLVELNEFGQIIKDGSSEYSYNILGNLIEKRKGRKVIRYSYDALDRLQKIESDDAKEEYVYDIFYRRLISKTLRGPITFLWSGNVELGSIRSDHIQELKLTPEIVELPSKPYQPFLALRDYRGSILAFVDLGKKQVAETYRYSAFGEEKIFDEKAKLIARSNLSNPWGFCGKTRVKGLDALYFGKRFYDADLMGFISQDPLTFVDGINSTGYALNDPIRNVDPDGLFTWPVDFEQFKTGAKAAIDTIYKKSVQSLTFAQSQMEWFYEFQAHFEDVGFKLMNKTFWTFLGYNPDPTLAGVTGELEGHDKVRITMINGMLNPMSGTQANADFLSQSHGRNKVHYLYAATKGFTGDVLRSLFAKVGFISQQARLLAKTWKELIDEMGGAANGGRIIHYAHSLGGADTYGALQLLSEDERKMIHVNTFGSPVFIDKELCGSASNFASSHDIIPCFDVVGYIQALSNKRDDVTFLPSKRPVYTHIPFLDRVMDHSFSGDTYRATLEELGQYFQTEYLKGEVFAKELTPQIVQQANFMSFTEKAIKPATPGKILWVKRKISRFTRQSKYRALGRILRAELNKSVTLEQVEAIAIRHNSKILLKAIWAARNIKNLNTDLGLKRSEILQITLFIEAELKRYIKKQKYYLREEKTGLARIVEYDPKTKRVFIHLGTKKIAMIGQGCHKTVTKSILYNLEQPEIVANCRSPLKDKEEMKIIKSLQGTPGIVEGKAFITHTQQNAQEEMLEIILKLYNASSLRTIFYNESEKFSLSEKLDIAVQLLQGLEGIHNIGIVHRDLHSANFLVDIRRDHATGKRIVKAAITDFGRAVKKEECKGIDPQAYRWYRSPESFFYEKMVPNDYPPADIYALGCVLFRIYFERDPRWFDDKYFKIPDENENTRKQAKKNLIKVIHSEMDERKRDINSRQEKTAEEEFELLIYQMVHPEKDKRGTAQELSKKMKEIHQKGTPS